MDIEHRIKNIIITEGKISIAKFMHEIIASPQGYYNSNTPFGARGDFVTAPEISQLFGEMIGIWCAEIWIKLNRPKNLSLVEFGPGNGTLMSDILRATKHVLGFHLALEINFIEISEKLKIAQSKKLSSYNIKKNWLKSLFDLQIDSPCIFIANEFFDALPINQYKKQKGKWYEVFITLNNRYELEFIDIEIDKKHSDNLNFDYPNICDNSTIEISNDSSKIVSHISYLLQKNSGAALIIDYGYDIDNTERVEMTSSLQSVKNHKFNPIFLNIGNADITSHIDFTSLNSIAKLYGLNSRIDSQREFLVNQGIVIRAQSLARNLPFKMQKDLYNNLDRLISQDKMGDLFKVLEIT